MAQEQKARITKKDIIDYVTKMEIKKGGIGGLDKVDVYVHIQEIVKMYDAYTEQELGAKEAEVAAKFQTQMDTQKAKEADMRKDLEASQAAAASAVEEAEKQKRQVESLARFKDLSAELKTKTESQEKELDLLKKKLAEVEGSAVAGQVAVSSAEVEQYKVKIAQLEAEVALLKEKNEVLSAENKDLTPGMIQDYTNEIMTLKDELRRRTAETKDLTSKIADLEAQREGGFRSGSKDAFSYSDEIGDILREARKEGQHIIDNARNEAEQEMIKVLNLRAKHKAENESYRNWCKRVEVEKRSIEEFLTQLAIQFKNANRALASVKEDADAFDVERIFNVVDLPPGKLEEMDSDDF